MNNVPSGAKQLAQIAQIVEQVRSQMCPTGECRYEVRGGGPVTIVGGITSKDGEYFHFEIMVRFEDDKVTRIFAVMGIGNRQRTYIWDETTSSWRAT